MTYLRGEIMARKPRIHYEGALYHVICRGNNREYIFKEENDKEKYIEIIKKYKKRYSFKLFAYCLMDNHVHLLIEVNHVPLSKVMQGIQQVYTQYYNKKHLHSGHVFEQRYKSVLCDKDQYLLALIRYIHQNPVMAGFDTGIKYKWSSHKDYLSGNINSITDVEFPLSIFEGEITTQIRRYTEFMDILESDINDISSRELAEHIDEYKEIKDMNDEKGGKEIYSKEYIINLVCKYFEIEIEELRKKSRKTNNVKARKFIIFLLKDYTEISNVEISLLLNLSQPTVSNILSDSVLKDNYEDELLKVIKL